MNAISSNRLVDKDYCRKVLNAETVNLFFGVIVPFSFVLAEFLVIVTSFSYAIYVFGISIIPGAGMVLFALFLVMLVMRHKARVVGEDRAAFERKKLKIVELLLQASYMISINGGGNWFKSQFLETNKGFAVHLVSRLYFHILPSLLLMVFWY
jgi:ABC-type transport system involved in cytochrome bd biosynthesis fused ATPase/permease subunit